MTKLSECLGLGRIPGLSNSGTFGGVRALFGQTGGICLGNVDVGKFIKRVSFAPVHGYHGSTLDRLRALLGMGVS